MPIPTFNGTALCSAGQHDAPHSPEVRAYAETLPGLDGRFVQPHGVGARAIDLAGSLAAAGASPAAAHQALKAALRERQALADGRTVATYVGADGHDYTNCMLLSYQPAGAVSVSAAGASYQARIAVRARLQQLVPTT